MGGDFAQFNTIALCSITIGLSNEIAAAFNSFHVCRRKLCNNGSISAALSGL
jgi:hypothetical protein